MHHKLVLVEGGLRCAGVAEASAAKRDAGAPGARFDERVRDRRTLAAANIEGDGAPSVGGVARAVDADERNTVAVAKGSIQSGLAPVRAGDRHAASIISYVTRPKRRASA